jgi:type IV pilus assembly protein PilY1
MTTINKLRTTLLAALLPAIVSFPLLAEDIEVYLGGTGATEGTNPNILFILDSSGSMGSSVFTQPTYDPTITHPGSCATDRYYWSSSGGAPSCSTDNFVYTTVFHCDAALAGFNAVGRHTDRYAQWRTSDRRWRSMNDDYNSRLTECQDDDGNHGEYGNNPNGRRFSNYYGSGPWATTDASNFNWSWRSSATFFTGNYLNWYFDNPATFLGTRLQVMQDVMNGLLGGINDVNVGLMRFDRYSNGGMVISAVADIEAGTNRADTISAVNSVVASGGTPLSETLWEAYRYYAGANVDYGRNSYRASSSPFPSVADSRVGGSSSNNTYDSPIDLQCQRNFIVLLTDGEPTSDGSRNSSILGLPGMSSLDTSCGSNCMDELSLYMFQRDLNSTLNGEQNVVTYTIGFATDQQLLEDTAERGGGEYFVADDTAGLTDALTSIITEILAVNTTFTAPAVSVNAFNRTVHLTQLYFTIFKPAQTPHWDGNVKRFDIAIPNGGTVATIVDVNNEVAVDPATGFFADSATSFWTDADNAPDGGDVALGGAAGELTATRNVYTYTGAADLSVTANALHESNAAITKTVLGDPAMSDADRTSLIQWARGIDVDDDDDDGSSVDARQFMGDPLHSKPVVVTYGGNAANPDIAIYLTTNDGFLHAFDADDGSELFSFIPLELIDDLQMLRTNTVGSSTTKHYALDSPIAVWTTDRDGDGIIEAGDGDRVYLYFGMRRGGQDYYAVDVTDRSAPEFLWRTTGGIGDLSEMGESWAEPIIATIDVGGTEKTVLIVGGGNDPNADADLYSPDGQGRAVYMIDAENGNVVWWAGPSGSGANLEIAEMVASIPSQVRVIDMDGNGLDDRMYVGDVGGQLFRFDIDNGASAASLVDGGVIAQLGAEGVTATVVNSRRFYEPPDVALIVDEDSSNYLNISIGSGDRSHPLGTQTLDRFYAVRDTYIFETPPSYGYGVTESSMYDATANLIGEGANPDVQLELLDGSDGWYIDLVTGSGAMQGEKVLARAQTIQNRILFTTFTPIISGATSTGCSPSQGTARTYIVSASTAVPVLDLNEDGQDDLEADDRSLDLVRGGIPPEVTVLFPESDPNNPIGLVGPEQVPIDLENVPVLTYWYQTDLEDDGG